MDKKVIYFLIGLMVFELVSCTQKEKATDTVKKQTTDTVKVQTSDTVRDYCVQKISAIINRFNPQMETNRKTEIADVIYEMTVKYPNLDIDIICAVITYGTGRTWNPEVVSDGGAMGLMQIMPTTGMHVAQYEEIKWTSPEDILFNPIYNIRLGCRYLSSLISEYDLDGGLAAYNGGESRAAEWVRQERAAGILAETTASFVVSVLQIVNDYRQMN
jgi:soluble lytic murein transglycosylase-like protein